jgi:hypothetical protein
MGGFTFVCTESFEKYPIFIIGNQNKSIFIKGISGGCDGRQGCFFHVKRAVAWGSFR